MNDENPLLEFTRGNPHRARHLQRCFEIIRDYAPDSAVRRTADDVLRGKLTPRDALRHREFEETLLPGMRTSSSQLIRSMIG